MTDACQPALKLSGVAGLFLLSKSSFSLYISSFFTYSSRFTYKSITKVPISDRAMSTLGGASYSDRLDALAKRVAAYNRKGKKNGLADLLKDVTAVVREAEASNAPELAETVDKAGQICDSAIHWAYGDGKIDFLPSYGHAPGAGPVEDPMQRLGMHPLCSTYAYIPADLVFQASRMYRRWCRW